MHQKTMTITFSAEETFFTFFEVDFMAAIHGFGCTLLSRR
jgi:hypothetical protein